MIQDTYLISYILSYLVQCNDCNKYIIKDKLNSCCICNVYCCNHCIIKLKSFYGFYQNKYCIDCELIYFR